MAKKDRLPRLTLKTARELALKVLGTAKGLAKDPEYTIDVYKMRLGCLFVEIRYDWFGSERISVSVDNHFGHAVFMLFDPATLKEDHEAEDRQKERDKREQFADWVGTNGPDVCKALIDKEWERKR